MFTLHVRNYQSIEDATVEVRGLTVVTGPNNLGKSALSRALFGLVSNPKGSKFVRYGKDHCSVTLDLGEGAPVVTWEKGEKVNRYIVDGKTLDKVGPRVVPDEVQALGILPVQLSGKDPVWPQFAHQFTGQVFLLDQPGSVLAEAIANVDRVGVLNEALRLAQSDQRSATAERKVRLSDTTRLEALEREYDWVDGAETVLAAAEETGATIDDMNARLTALRATHDRLTTLNETVQGLSPVRELSPPASERLVRFEGGYRWVTEMSVRMAEAVVARDRAKRAVEVLSNVGLPPAPDFRVQGERLKALRGVLQSLEGAVKEVARLKAESERLAGELAVANEELATLQGSITECPVCGSTTVKDGCVV